MTPAVIIAVKALAIVAALFLIAFVALSRVTVEPRGGPDDPAYTASDFLADAGAIAVVAAAMLLVVFMPQ